MDSQIKDKALQIMKITDGEICNNCLGRNFSKLIEGVDNKQRGQYIKKILAEEGYNNLNSDSCYICQDIIKEITPELIERVIKKIDSVGVEFSTFLVGTRVSKELIQKEENLHEKVGLDVENIKKELNREIGKKLSLKTGKEVEFDTPEIIILVDFLNDNIEIQINPLFIEGRYRKLIRGIPQTKWPCRKCKGKGCGYCNYTGKMYAESVEELIEPEALKMTKGNISKFHGAGREDIDVKMLGNGRPFVLEIKEPLKRKIDLEDLEKKINKSAHGKVEVLDLKFVEKDRRSVIKSSSKDTYKVYLARVTLDEEVAPEKLKILKSLKIIHQRTPIRVSHRRADKIRIRSIKHIEVKMVNPKELELVIECEGGLYIKELISGDEDRTKPSVSQLLEKHAKCKKLNVLDVNI
ncbi:MAG: tRNA pseudouridine(54/55) synthase Pus10 [Methanobacteriaceae archaeon]|nr:tRNA pseudouridine(54/55) synthase Pus10 [Methanobacteriaceae archaeon]